MSPAPRWVDVTLRIDERNLEQLLASRHPAAALWLEQDDAGVVSLHADTPLAFEASIDAINHNPDATFPRLRPEQRQRLARRWQADPEAWWRAVKRAFGDELEASEGTADLRETVERTRDRTRPPDFPDR